MNDGTRENQAKASNKDSGEVLETWRRLHWNRNVIDADKQDTTRKIEKHEEKVIEADGSSHSIFGFVLGGNLEPFRMFHSSY